VVEEKSKFKDMKTSGWVTLGEPEPEPDEHPVIANQEEFLHEQLAKPKVQRTIEELPKEPKKRKKEKTAAEGEDGPGETIYRDKFGKKVSLASKKAEKFARERKEEEEMIKQMEWGKGLVQKQEAEDLRAREEAEKLKPLARYADDDELNEELKNRVRWGDPTGGSTSSKKKKKKKERPKYQGVFPANRFNIAPGYRWDGVDRSNGFEKKYLLAINESMAKKESFYKWSTEDM
jgi:pre-mRNA-splicing factor CWC26